ncbi:MAG TPA: hypothetical protein VE569_08730 [Acidimicrobiia bacterium]|nr:hypothetical protein [Acidimicrobiia bacterium]
MTKPVGEGSRDAAGRHGPLKALGVESDSTGWARWLAWLTVLLVGAVAVYSALISADEVKTAPLVGVMYLMTGVVFAFTAALILSNRRGNRVGWILMAIAAGLALSNLADVTVPTNAPSTVTPWLFALLVFRGVSWVFFIFPIFHLLLIFPSGRLLSPRWRLLVVLEVLMITTLLFLETFGPEIGAVADDGETYLWTVANPIGLLHTDIFDGVFSGVWTGLLLVLTVGGLIAMVLRFRRADSVERLQLKWLFLAVALFVVVYGLTAVLEGYDDNSILGVLFILSIIGIAVAIAVAVLRYRLYEIDRVISRAVGYTLVVVVLGLVYAVGAVWLPTRILGQQPPLFVAGSTLAVAALFNPLRQRVMSGVDRRFYRSRYNAERVVADFTGRLRDEVDIRQLTGDLMDVISTTMRPSTLGVWVRES